VGTALSLDAKGETALGRRETGGDPVLLGLAREGPERAARRGCISRGDSEPESAALRGEEEGGEEGGLPERSWLPDAVRACRRG
jgi:hypothetical protein